MLTPEGIRTFDEIDAGSVIWSREGWTTVLKKWSTGVNPVFAYRTNGGVFYGTEGHKVVQGGVKVEASKAAGIDCLVGPLYPDFKFDERAYEEGLISVDAIPTKYIYASSDVVRSFITGLIDNANMFSGGDLSIHCRDAKYAEAVQMMFSSTGISSEFNADSSKISFWPSDHTRTIDKVERISSEETFDITVDNPSHTYWTQGCDVSNCVEACFWPQIEIDGVLHTGWQFCNLGSINVAAVETVEEFYEECETTAMVCTFQAGFNKYDYLGHVSEAITNREALILVSMTGIMDRADVVLKPEVLEQGARIVKEANERLARKIGINSSSRTTGIKPEGTGSLLLGTLAAGRHGWPFKRGIRHVQANKTENVLNFFKMYNPHAIEHSVWSTNGVDDVVLFPIEAPDGAVLEREMTAIESLEQVKMLQVHWVNAGRRPELCTQSYLQNSVSNTIKVGDDEWDDVADYIYDNREYFTGVALLGRSGDKDFRQAPNVSVPTDEEILEIYGEPLTVLSQELVAAVEPGSEWDAIAYFGGDESVKPSSEWVSLRTYLDEWLELAGVDVRRAVYCMKDVYYNKKYKNLVANWTPVPYDLMVELDDTTAFTGESACAGGACTI